ncbi:MAG TPA: hypothetical protein VFZ11_02970 [Gemmatimonadaceae bacterium]
MQQERTSAIDGGSERGRSLFDAAHAALRSALGAELREAQPGAAVPTARLRHGLRLLCDAARDRGVRAEQLVVVIKHAWSTLPEAQWRPDSDRGLPLLERVVSMCIEEYYADRLDDGARRPVAVSPAPKLRDR